MNNLSPIKRPRDFSELEIKMNRFFRSLVFKLGFILLILPIFLSAVSAILWTMANMFFPGVSIENFFFVLLLYWGATTFFTIMAHVTS